ncbi:MAG: hypothetical protein ABH870_04600 [bacterium]
MINWVKRMLSHILFIQDKDVVQQYICNDCHKTFPSENAHLLKQLRQSVKLFVCKFICLLRFKEGLSLRSISRIVDFAFGINSSLGYLSKFTNTIGQKAQDKIKKLSQCQATETATVVIIDETFPKIFHKSICLGLVICEYGLIRGIACVKKSSSSIKGLVRQCIGKSFQPTFLLGDFLPAYAEVAKQLKLTRLTDFVHAIRHIYKLVRVHIGEIRLTIKDHQKFTPKKRKELLKLKKKLLRKQIMPVIQTLFKGLKKEYCAVGHLYILGALTEIERLTEQFPCLEPLYKAVNKFVHKYIDTWKLQMELSHIVSTIPTTSNSIESKNSILRIFSKRIKAFFSTTSLLRFFSAVALWENFDIKERGTHKGTSAIQRAGINLEDFNATSFFKAVELENVSQQNTKRFDSDKIVSYLFTQILAQAV